MSLTTPRCRYDNLFRLANESVNNVKSWFNDLTLWSGETVKPEEYKDTLLNLEPGLVYPAKAGSFNGSMRITIDKDLTVDIPLHELWRPLRGLDADGKMILHDRFNELQIYGADASQSLYAPVLGKAFLSQVSFLSRVRSSLMYLTAVSRIGVFVCQL